MQDEPVVRTIGVDVGGTFTDYVFLKTNGEFEVRKVASTPDDPARGVIQGLRSARGEGLLVVPYTLSHGTTVATNALLERRGAATTLITTRGFRDVLEIGRQTRSRLYALVPERPAPLVPRERCSEITERVDWQGRVLIPLDETETAGMLDALERGKIESIAVCFLFSYLAPEHERRVGEMARERGFLVSLSSDIAPEPREFERASTTLANAYVAPILARYLNRLADAVRNEGASRLRVMQSNGGALSASEARACAIKTALSGPAGGVIAAARIAADAGYGEVLTFDMGGTSTDVALIDHGDCPIVTTASLGDIPLRTPMLDIHTVGAGGGSLAWIDGAGALRVGPQSAGADPGPAAYGKSDQLTVTDANILLGRLPGDLLLGDRLALDAARVRECFEKFCRPLGREPEVIALGIVNIAEAAMARALRHVSVERGRDPARFALLSFGGAGGLHACALAEALGIPNVIIPRYPGALSALGLAIAPIQHEALRSFPAVVVSDHQKAVSASVIEEAAAHLQDQLRPQAAAAEEEGIALQAHYRVDLRYVGQSFELRIPLDLMDLPAAVDHFHQHHRSRYGHADPREPVEATAVRLILTGRAALPPLRVRMPSEAGQLLRKTQLYDVSGRTAADVYAREALAEGQLITGPALALQSDATTFVPGGWIGTTDSLGNIRLSTKN